MDRAAAMTVLAAGMGIGYVARVSGAPAWLAAAAAAALPAASAAALRAASAQVGGFSAAIPARRIYASLALVAASVLAVFGAAPLLASPRYRGPALLAVAAGLTLLGAVTGGPRLRLALDAASFKTSAEVEAPLMSLTVYLLSHSHLTLHDIVEYVASSAALRAWARVFRQVKNTAAATGASLVSAMREVARRHTSPSVRLFLERMAVASVTTGDVSQVAEKLFTAVVEKLEARLETSAEKLRILNGLVLFVFFFMPVIVVSMAPVMGVSRNTVAMVAALDAVVGFVIYVLVTAAYPSLFAIRLPGSYLASSAVSLAAAVAVLAAYAVAGLPRTALAAAALALAPAAVIGEAARRQVDVYNYFARLAGDAAEAAATSGEDYIHALQRLAEDAPPPVKRLVRRLAYLYKSGRLSRHLVATAPTLLHAGLVESVVYAARVGADPEAVATVLRMYEKLVELRERFRQVGRSLTGTVYVTVVIVGLMVSFVTRMFGRLAAMMRSSGASVPLGLPLASFNPASVQGISALTLLFGVLLAFFAGKVREGSAVAGARDALVIIVIYAVIAWLPLG